MRTKILSNIRPKFLTFRFNFTLTLQFISVSLKYIEKQMFEQLKNPIKNQQKHRQNRYP